MMRIPGYAAFGLVLVFAACTRYADVGTDTIGPGYATGGGEWNSGGGITVVTHAFERNGVTVVCGAWTTDRQSALTIFLNEDVIETGSVYAGNTRLVQNLGFMPRVPYSNNIAGAQAVCVASPVTWRAEFAEIGPRLRFPRVAFSDGGGDENSGGGGSPVIFRQTARLDIVR